MISVEYTHKQTEQVTGIKTTKKILQPREQYKLRIYANTDRERVWRPTQRINFQSQTGRSIPDTRYTAINITITLQYFLRPDLQVNKN